MIIFLKDHMRRFCQTGKKDIWLSIKSSLKELASAAEHRQDSGVDTEWLSGLLHRSLGRCVLPKCSQQQWGN